MYKLWCSSISATALCFALAGCGSTPKKVVQQPESIDVPDNQETEVLEHSPEYYLSKAEQAMVIDNNTFARNQWILRAAEVYKQHEQCQQVNKIVQLSLPELQSRQLVNQAHLLAAECIAMDTPPDYAALEQRLEELDPALGYRNRIYQIQLTLLTHQKRWLKAAKVRMNTVLDSDMHLDVWYLLQNLSDSELEHARLDEPALQPWLQLSLITRRYGLHSDILQDEVSAFEQRFIHHPLAKNLPEELQAALAIDPKPIARIAVLLPLSGRFASQGLAIKQGVLAAYLQDRPDSKHSDESPQTTLTFIDTNISQGEQLAQRVTDYEVIIGPLMKEQVEGFLPFAPMTADIISLNQIEQNIEPQPALEPMNDEIGVVLESASQPQAIPVLEPVKAGKRIYFALSPEDEAWQLAKTVYHKGIRHPIVVSQESGASRRMAEAFLQHWLRLEDDDDSSPAFATFTDNKSMRTSVTTLLDVAQSNTRIDQVKYLTSDEVHSVPRNRRDIDGIVIFASAQQTELLNPIIESSLSPFNDKAVPVFASSRSFSKHLSNNSLRDLRNLTFSDMPWMLPGHAWPELADEVERIWPQLDDTLSRLFALGFDAFKLTPVIEQLNTLPQISMSGLTGKLAVDGQGNVTRQLALGRIGDDKVERLEMD